MPRLLFEKTGKAVWISHLDLMRLFQRAFKRADLPLKHTQGFNPRASVSIALPLSVGTWSVCELLDFDLDGCNAPCEEILDRLNTSLVDGVKVLSVYEQGRKIRDLALLRCEVTLYYDKGIPEYAIERIQELFERESLFVPRKTKNGIQEQDVIPMIRSLAIVKAGERELQVNTVICCQNPALNPNQLVRAIETHLPEFAPDHSATARIEIYDCNENVFR